MPTGRQPRMGQDRGGATGGGGGDVLAATTRPFLGLFLLWIAPGHLRAMGGGGGRRRDLGVCQYPRLVCLLYGAFQACCEEKGGNLLAEIMREDGIQVGDVFGWLGKKIRWGGFETNNLCRALPRLCELAESSRYYGV